MKYLKLGLISAVIFGLILFLMSLLIPSTVRISRAINIHAQRAVVYPLIADIDRWREWNEMNLDSIQVSVLSDSNYHFETAWEYGGRAIHSGFWLEESANITVVQWYFDIALKWYPWEKFGSIIFDKQFGPLMEQSLHNLQQRVENLR